MKSAITEKKNRIETIKSRLLERISVVENRKQQSNQADGKGKNRISKNEKILKEV